MGFPFRVDNSRCAVAVTGGRGSARAAISLLANIPILPEPIVVFPLEASASRISRPQRTSAFRAPTLERRRQ